MAPKMALSPSYRSPRNNYGPSPSERASFTVDESSEFFAKQNAKITADNEKLKAQLADALAQIDKLSANAVKAEVEITAAQEQAAKAKSKIGPRRMTTINEPPDDGLGGALSTKASTSRAGASSSGGTTPKVDSRKMLDDFKKPLDDTRAIIEEHLNGKGVPTALSIGLVEEMQDALRRQRERVLTVTARLEALTMRVPLPHKLPVPQKKKHEAKLADLKSELRVAEAEVGTLQEKMVARRDDVLARTAVELVKTLDSYGKAYEELPKDKWEGMALKKITTLCEDYLPEKLDEDEVPRPVQPPDLGAGDNERTLLRLAERAAEAVKAGGALDRLGKAAIEQAGVKECTMELNSCKGFRDALHRAHSECGGNYLNLCDMARVHIICPKLANLSEGLRWLLEDAKKWSVDDSDLPAFEPIMIDDRLSPGYDAEGHDVIRCVIVTGRMMCDGGVQLTVEMHWHVKILYALRKKLQMLYEGRSSLQASEDHIALHEGTLDKGAIDRAAKGLVTRIRCPDQAEAISSGTRDALVALVQSDKCTLTELSLSNSTGLAGLDLSDQFLVPELGMGILRCSRLRVIKLAKLKLKGGIPTQINRMKWLNTLELQDNALTGPVPDELRECKLLETVALHGNALTGRVPCAAFISLLNLTMLTLGGKAGGNPDLEITTEGKSALEDSHADTCELYLPAKVVEGTAEDVDALIGKLDEEEAAEEAHDAKRAANAKAKRERDLKRKELAKKVEELGQSKAKEEEEKEKEAARARAKAALEQKQQDEIDKAERERVAEVRDGILDAAKRREAEERKLDQGIRKHLEPPKKTVEELAERRANQVRQMAQSSKGNFGEGSPAPAPASASGSPKSRRTSVKKKWPPSPRADEDEDVGAAQGSALAVNTGKVAI